MYSAIVWTIWRSEEEEEHWSGAAGAASLTKAQINLLEALILNLEPELQQPTTLTDSPTLNEWRLSVSGSVSSNRFALMDSRVSDNGKAHAVLPFDEGKCFCLLAFFTVYGEEHGRLNKCDPGC